MKQQYRFRDIKCRLIDDGWSCWYPLDEDHVFYESMDYQFRWAPEKPPLEDGIYTQLDALGRVKGKAYSRHEGYWYVGDVRYVGDIDGSGVASNFHDNEMSDEIARRNGYVRMVKAS